MPILMLQEFLVLLGVPTFGTDIDGDSQIGPTALTVASKLIVDPPVDMG